MCSANGGGVGRPSQRLAVRPAMEDMLGSEFEETSGIWDPFNLGKDESKLYRYRCAEIKHGRVAQLAVMGMIIGDHITFPGNLATIPAEIKFSDVPAGLGALSVVPAAGWLQILAFAGFMENGPFKQNPNKAPGDIASFDWWVRYDDPAVKTRKLKAELKNGRLAMMGFAGMVAQEMVTGQTIVQQVQAGNINPFHL